MCPRLNGFLRPPLLLANVNVWRKQCEKGFQMVMEKKRPHDMNLRHMNKEESCLQEGDMNKEGRKKTSGDQQRSRKL